MCSSARLRSKSDDYNNNQITLAVNEIVFILLLLLCEPLVETRMTSTVYFPKIEDRSMSVASRSVRTRGRGGWLFSHVR